MQLTTDRKPAAAPAGKRRIGYFTVLSGLLLALPHRATLAALGLIFLVAPGITYALIETGVWPAFVRFVS